MKGRRLHAPVGSRSGRLVVVEDLGVDAAQASIVRVQCDCGATKVIHTRQFLDVRNKSCGCWRRERAGNLNLRHGASSASPEYRVWCSMISRCESTTWRDYANYGGRGIAVCQRWRESFEAFLDDMGSRPSPKHSLDRIDVNGNYEPGNCRWATLVEQANNKRNSAKVAAFDEVLTVAEWSRRTGITRRAIEFRIKAGWSAERAVSHPLRITSRRPA